MQSVEECPAVAHLEQVSCPRQEVCECPNLWHLKQRRGFGIYERILQFRSDSEITPLQELSVLCGLMVTEESRKDLTSSPPIPIRALLIANSEFVNIPLSGKDKSKNLVCAAILSTLEGWVIQGLYPGTADLDPYAQKKTSCWCASTHHGVQQGRQCAGHLAKTRHGAYLEYTQNIMLQHQGEDPTVNRLEYIKLYCRNSNLGHHTGQANAVRGINADQIRCSQLASVDKNNALREIKLRLSYLQGKSTTMSVIAHQTEKEWISANEKSRQRMSQTQAEGAAKQHAARLEEAHLRAHLCQT
ncbi:hypothetical protein TNCV_4071451 [Trichonephila clavipes]|uniref:Uncharacterized protein n=1 Tax=Trichonephila clavipes TaxID=2585209 RepID=A0A8X6W895_TRICX|nr:hypothetical protein TNCV_4071451 [Trichonephila clavipes]